MRPLLIKICGNRDPDDSRRVADFGPDMMGWIFSWKSPRKVPAPDAARLIGRIRSDHPSILHVGVFAGNSLAEILRTNEECPGLDLLQIVEGSGFVARLAAMFSPVTLQLRTGRIRSCLPVIPAVRIARPADESDFAGYPPVPFFILDAFDPEKPGGTGRRIRAEWLQKVDRPYILAGGLHPDNVVQALQETRPIGVDVSSGLEQSPGRKDFEKVRLFFERVRAYEKNR